MATKFGYQVCNILKGCIRYPIWQLSLEYLKKKNLIYWIWLPTLATKIKTFLKYPVDIGMATNFGYQVWNILQVFARYWLWLPTLANKFGNCLEKVFLRYWIWLPSLILDMATWKHYCWLMSLYSLSPEMTSKNILDKLLSRFWLFCFYNFTSFRLMERKLSTYIQLSLSDQNSNLEIYANEFIFNLINSFTKLKIQNILVLSFQMGSKGFMVILIS